MLRRPRSNAAPRTLANNKVPRQKKFGRTALPAAFLRLPRPHARGGGASLSPRRAALEMAPATVFGSEPRATLNLEKHGMGHGVDDVPPGVWGWQGWLLVEFFTIPWNNLLSLARGHIGSGAAPWCTFLTQC